MARIEHEFSLRTQFGKFFEYVDKLQEGVDRTDRQTDALNRMERAANAAGSSAASAQREIETSAAGASDATMELVRQLEPLQKAVTSAVKAGNMEGAKLSAQDLLQAMNRLELSFTNLRGTASQTEAIMRTSLEDLAQAGEIAARRTEEIQYQDTVSPGARRSASALKRLGDSAADAARKLQRIGKAANPLDGLANRMVRMVAMLFTTRRLLRYIINAAKRAPDEVMADFTALKKEGSDVFARITVSAMSGMRSGLRSLTKALNSSGGQKFFRGLEKAATMAGRVVGKAMELIGKGIEFIGDHSEEAFTIAAIAAGFFAAQMLAAAAANIAMNAPLYLTIGLLSALVAWLMKAGYTASDIFGTVGEVFAWLYTLIYNRIVDMHNKVAVFAEFLLNVFRDPANAVGNLFYDLFDWVLSGLETTARAIDAIAAKFNVKWTLGNEIAGLREAIQAEKAEKFAENAIKVDRWEHIDFDAMMEKWGAIGEKFGAGITGDALANLLAPEIKAIESDTDAIRKSVQLSEEDLRSLVDTAERQYVNRISLTSQTPVITINGANTGRTAEDRQALADAIAEVLMEQTASGAVIATALP